LNRGRRSRADGPALHGAAAAAAADTDAAPQISRILQPRQPFSDADVSLLSDSEPFRARARVLARVERIFGSLREHLRRQVADGNYLAPLGLDRDQGKIGRGEYLDDLPYVYLDLPRYFDATGAFTFRSLFWWGHGVSFSLILGGPHLPAYRDRVLQNVDVLQALDVNVALGVDPWDWRHGEGHTLPIRRGGETELFSALRGRSFLKCSRFLSFGDEEFRANRIDEAALLTFRALEPIVLA